MFFSKRNFGILQSIFMKSFNANASFSNKKGIVTVNLAVILFKEDNAQILFCPALALSGSGNTIAEAQQSFAIALEEYLKYTINKGTLWADLRKLGWTIQKKKPATPPPMSELLESNDEFSRIFDTKPYKKFDTGVHLPAYA